MTPGGVRKISRKTKRWPLRLVPLGGMGEIGKNMIVVEYEDNIIVIDAGLAFPDDEMPGVDIVIPDYQYLVERKAQVHGIFLTHGHEDHVGGIPYLLRELDVPVYGSRLTLGMVKAKLREHQLTLHKDSRELSPRTWISAGPFRIMPFRVTHSIPDSFGYAVETPIGLVVFTGDYKFDQTPVDGKPTDYATLAELGERGVLVMVGDSTNVERPGVTPSEREVGQSIYDVIRSAGGRVFLATFASNLHRIQQVFDAARALKRKVAVVGRSMENNVRVAMELGYLTNVDDVLIDVKHLHRHPPERVVVLTTGSQGEPLSALSRMAVGEHAHVEIGPGDTVILAATPVPGNEKLVQRTIDNLYRLGANVVYGQDAMIHVSGHAMRDELKLMINLLRPMFLVPFHGEYRHLVRHAELGRQMGIPEERILFGENGDVFGFDGKRAAILHNVGAGNVLVDGLGVGDVGQVVLRDRNQLAKDGIVIVVVAIDKQGKIVAGPDIISRGFVYMREAEALLEDARARVSGVLNELERQRVREWNAYKSAIRDVLGQFLYQSTHRRPMILPIVMET